MRTGQDGSGQLYCYADKLIPQSNVRSTSQPCDKLDHPNDEVKRATSWTAQTMKRKAISSVIKSKLENMFLKSNKRYVRTKCEE